MTTYPKTTGQLYNICYNPDPTVFTWPEAVEAGNLSVTIENGTWYTGMVNSTVTYDYYVADNQAYVKYEPLPVGELPVAERVRLVRGIAGTIERAGWWNGRGPQQERHCVVTALSANIFTELGEEWWSLNGYNGRNAYLDVYRAIKRALELPDVAFVECWNDSHENGEDVIRALRLIADKWEADEGTMLGWEVEDSWSQ